MKRLKVATERYEPNEDFSIRSFSVIRLKWTNTKFLKFYIPQRVVFS